MAQRLLGELQARTQGFKSFLLAAVLLPLLVGCRKSEPPVPVVVDCGEDFGCLVRQAQGCKPASARVRQEYTVEDKTVRGLARYEVVGRVRGQCHVRRTQIEPPLGTYSRPPETWKDPRPRSRPLPPTPKIRPGELPLPMMQCLYPEEQVAEVLRRVQQVASTQEDLDLCYPGEGGCDETPTPILGPRCFTDDCLLGRWTYTCDRYRGRKLTIHECIGTRISDENPGCLLLCKDGRHELVGCRGGLDDLPWNEVLLPDSPLRLPDGGIKGH